MPKSTLKSQGEKSVGVSYSKEEAGTGWLTASNDDSNNYDGYGEDNSRDWLWVVSSARCYAGLHIEFV